MIKQLIRRFFAFFNLEIRGKSNLRYTIEESLNHLKDRGFNPDVVIDAGTAAGTVPLLRCFPSNRFFWIEAVKEFEPKIKELQKRFKGSYELSAVGSMEGEIPMNVHTDGLTGSSLYEEIDQVSSVQRQVPIQTLDNWRDKHDLKGSILLKMDVQGAELEVLKGASSILKDVEVILAEVSFFNFQKGAPDFYDIVHYLKEIGFVVYDIVEGHNRPLDQALAQKDLIFVQENGRFRQSHEWAGDSQKRQTAEKKNTKEFQKVSSEV